MKSFVTNLLLTSFLFIQFSYSQDEARLLRFPTIYEDQIVFSYAGDLYSVNSNGGVARRLTSHDGYEMFPRFSPDGKQIAFTGQYDGNTEVFLIPAEGGVPKRLTHTATLSRDDLGDRMGPNNLVITWTPDGNNIVFRSRKQSFNSFRGQLFTVPKEGGLSEEITLNDGGFCSWAPEGNKLAFNWVFREFRTWKYYEGGMADDIWIYDFDKKETSKITDNTSQDIIPMWAGDEIFYLSDRDRIMNLFVYNTTTKQTSKVTEFTDYDIKFPSLGKDFIVFEKGGYIYKLDLNDKTAVKVDIQIANDYIYARNELKDVSRSISYMDMSPNAERLIVTSRGDIFNVPSKNGITKNLTESSGINERNAIWSPDGKHIAYISDKTGEFEIYLEKYDSSDETVQLTSNSDTYIYNIMWSPDSKKILYNDKKHNLLYIDIDTKKLTAVDKSEFGVINSFNWSPDNKWITYTRPEKGMTKVRLYSLESKQSHEITEGWYSSSNPSFSLDGKYLIFTSARDFNPIYSRTEWNHAYQDMNKIYLATLAKTTPHPFKLENDKVVIETEKEEAKKESNADENSIKVDIDGIQGRIFSLPIKVSNYYNIIGLKDKIYYVERASGANASSAKIYDLSEKKETEIGTNLSFSISSNAKKMLVRKSGKYSIINVPNGKINTTETVDLSNMQVMVNHKMEWKQIFDESWRQMRDFFYAPNMHGLDWKAIYDKYVVLVPYANHRTDLTYIIGEMVGELNVGHAYVNNGERPVPERINMGLLGAKISPHSSGYFKVDKILQGANWNNAQRSPLTEIGVDIKEGDYIIAINGKSTKDVKDIYEYLIATNNETVELTVNSKPEETNSKITYVKPISDESELYYYNWIQANIKKVSEATNNLVGYIHVRDMGRTGLNDFIKHYYPQLVKKALIIDVRGNGGGNVSPMLIERLIREMTYVTMTTNQVEGSVNPGGTMVGPKVCLLDKYSASDGDLFPYRFKYHNLGKLIGTRSWGGVVGYSGPVQLIDGGSLITPRHAPYAADGSGFIIEGWGVEPDIVIENDPAKVYAGIDNQLDKAIEVILEELKNYKQKIPPIPEFPDKTKKRE